MRNFSGNCPECRQNIRSKNNTRYRDKTYDSVVFYLPKGKREKLKLYVHNHNMSMNEFVNNAIKCYIDEIEGKSKSKPPRKNEDTPF